MGRRTDSAGGSGRGRPCSPRRRPAPWRAPSVSGRGRTVGEEGDGPWSRGNREVRPCVAVGRRRGRSGLWSGPVSQSNGLGFSLLGDWITPSVPANFSAWNNGSACQRKDSQFEM